MAPDAAPHHLCLPLGATGVRLMSNDPAAVLRILFAIPQSQIDRDVAAGEQDFDHLMQGTYASHLEQRGSKDPRVTARYHHKQMVRAKVLRSRENVLEEQKLYFASMAAHGIAEEA